MNDSKKDEKQAAVAPQAPPPANDPGPEAQPSEPAAPPPASEADAKVAALEAELAARTAEFASFKESALLQLADALNQRRRAEAEMADARRYGAVPFARDTLVIADNLKRALVAAATPVEDASQAQRFESLRQGVEMIEREFAAILERHGLARIDPLGEKFDPNFHQAMFEVESAEAKPGTVVQVVQPGYRLHDRLLRPAMVGVAKAKADEPTPAPDANAEPESGPKADA
jgi:molecular chaperone GrpE